MKRDELVEKVSTDKESEYMKSMQTFIFPFFFDITTGLVNHSGIEHPESFLFLGAFSLLH